MKISKIEPKVITYALNAENDDEKFQCMWVRFMFDCDNGQLDISSDAGDYHYRWGYNVNEDFMHLMTRLNKEYLLNKIADRSIFNLDASKKTMIAKVKKYAIPNSWCKNGNEVSEIVSRIKSIECGCSEESFFREVQSLFQYIDWDYIECIKDYPHGAEVIVDLFEKYIQPKIKEDLQEKEKRA